MIKNKRIAWTLGLLTVFASASAIHEEFIEGYEFSPSKVNTPSKELPMSMYRDGKVVFFRNDTAYVATIGDAFDLENPEIQGRYIYWAAGTVGGAILFFFIFHISCGFVVGLIVATAILGVGGIMIFIKQRKGLHSKKEDKGLFIAARISSL